jgi:hypothetical protein
MTGAPSSAVVVGKQTVMRQEHEWWSPLLLHTGEKSKHVMLLPISRATKK